MNEISTSSVLLICMCVYLRGGLGWDLVMVRARGSKSLAGQGLADA